MELFRPNTIHIQPSTLLFICLFSLHMSCAPTNSVYQNLVAEDGSYRFFANDGVKYRDWTVSDFLLHDRIEYYHPEISSGCYNPNVDAVVLTDAEQNLQEITKRFLGDLSSCWREPGIPQNIFKYSNNNCFFWPPICEYGVWFPFFEFEFTTKIFDIILDNSDMILTHSEIQFGNTIIEGFVNERVISFPINIDDIMPGVFTYRLSITVDGIQNLNIERSFEVGL